MKARSRNRIQEEIETLEELKRDSTALNEQVSALTKPGLKDVGLYAESRDVKNHECTPPSVRIEDFPIELRDLRFECPTCGSQWHTAGPYYSGDKVCSWTRDSNSRNWWRKEVLNNLSKRSSIKAVESVL